MKKRIGIVGGGQLGRMMTIPAKKLGFTVTIIDPTPNSPAGQIADKEIVADFKDEKAIRELAAISDYLTFEIELANSAILEELASKGLKINPSAKTLSIIRDKLKQKKFLREAKIPVTDFADLPSSVIPSEVKRSRGISSTQVTQRQRSLHSLPLGRDDKLKEEIKQAAEKFDYPLLLKARFDAYDGRGNFLIEDETQIDKGIEKLGGRRLYVEKFVPFIKELAIMVARTSDGDMATYPIVETLQRNNILHVLFAPADINEMIAEKAKQLGITVMKHLKGAGVFGIEMFLTEDGKVLVNEIAPRVHNSGHYTIEANETSQFEQHVRAITGMPLGSTAMIVPAAVMINILGDHDGLAKAVGVKTAEKIPGVKVHIYGKLHTRKERKMGHITAVGKTVDEAYKKALKARELVSI